MTSRRKKFSIRHAREEEQSTFDRDIVPVLAAILQELCNSNDRQPSTTISKFHAASVPPISVLEYLQRIWKYAECSETCFVLALIYIDRVQSHPQFLVTSLNIHRLLITSIMIAAKFFDDHYYNNTFYGRIGGVSTVELNDLELEFLFMVGFSLSATSAEYEQYDRELRVHAVAVRHSFQTMPSVEESAAWRQVQYVADEEQQQFEHESKEGGQYPTQLQQLQYLAQRQQGMCALASTASSTAVSASSAALLVANTPSSASLLSVALSRGNGPSQHSRHAAPPPPPPPQPQQQQSQFAYMHYQYFGQPGAEQQQQQLLQQRRQPQHQHAGMRAQPSFVPEYGGVSPYVVNAQQQQQQQYHSLYQGQYSRLPEGSQYQPHQQSQPQAIYGCGQGYFDGGSGGHPFVFSQHSGRYFHPDGDPTGAVNAGVVRRGSLSPPCTPEAAMGPNPAVGGFYVASESPSQDWVLIQQ